MAEEETEGACPASPLRMCLAELSLRRSGGAGSRGSRGSSIPGVPVAGWTGTDTASSVALGGNGGQRRKSKGECTTADASGQVLRAVHHIPWKVDSEQKPGQSYSNFYRLSLRSKAVSFQLRPQSAVCRLRLLSGAPKMSRIL